MRQVQGNAPYVILEAGDTVEDVVAFGRAFGAINNSDEISIRVPLYDYTEKHPVCELSTIWPKLMRDVAKYTRDLEEKNKILNSNVILYQVISSILTLVLVVLLAVIVIIP